MARPRSSHFDRLLHTNGEPLATGRTLRMMDPGPGRGVEYRLLQFLCIETERAERTQFDLDHGIVALTNLRGLFVVDGMGNLELDGAQLVADPDDRVGLEAIFTDLDLDIVEVDPAALEDGLGHLVRSQDKRGKGECPFAREQFLGKSVECGFARALRVRAVREVRALAPYPAKREGFLTVEAQERTVFGPTDAPDMARDAVSTAGERDTQAAAIDRSYARRTGTSERDRFWSRQCVGHAASLSRKSKVRHSSRSTPALGRPAQLGPSTVPSVAFQVP
jgi:hypothetical protein